MPIVYIVTCRRSHHFDDNVEEWNDAAFSTREKAEAYRQRILASGPEDLCVRLDSLGLDEREGEGVLTGVFMSVSPDGEVLGEDATRYLPGEGGPCVDPFVFCRPDGSFLVSARTREEALGALRAAIEEKAREEPRPEADA